MDGLGPDYPLKLEGQAFENFGTRKGLRTPTHKGLVPKTSASANSAIRAKLLVRTEGIEPSPSKRNGF